MRPPFPFVDCEIYFYDVVNQVGNLALNVTNQKIELCPMNTKILFEKIKILCKNGSSTSYDYMSDEDVFYRIGEAMALIHDRTKRGYPTKIFSGKKMVEVLEHPNRKEILDEYGVDIHLDDSGVLGDCEAILGLISETEPEPESVVIEGLCVKGGKVYIQSEEAIRKSFHYLTINMGEKCQN